MVVTLSTAVCVGLRMEVNHGCLSKLSFIFFFPKFLFPPWFNFCQFWYCARVRRVCTLCFPASFMISLHSIFLEHSFDKYACMPLLTYSHTHTLTLTLTHMYMYVHTHTHVRARAHTHTHTHTHTHSYTPMLCRWSFHHEAHQVDWDLLLWTVCPSLPGACQQGSGRKGRRTIHVHVHACICTCNMHGPCKSY